MPESIYENLAASPDIMVIVQAIRLSKMTRQPFDILRAEEVPFRASTRTQATRVIQPTANQRVHLESSNVCTPTEVGKLVATANSTARSQADETRQ